MISLKAQPSTANRSRLSKRNGTTSRKRLPPRFYLSHATGQAGVLFWFRDCGEHEESQETSQRNLSGTGSNMPDTFRPPAQCNPRNWGLNWWKIFFINSCLNLNLNRARTAGTSYSPWCTIISRAWTRWWARTCVLRGPLFSAAWNPSRSVSVIASHVSTYLSTFNWKLRKLSQWSTRPCIRVIGTWLSLLHSLLLAKLHPPTRVL